jgi:hemerythrin
MFAEFDESLVTGNEMIDSQHKELISRINQLLSKCETSEDQFAAIKMLDYLSDYVEFHFGEEEKFQEEIGYPGIKEHKQKHAEFVETIAALRNMLEEEEGPSAAFVALVQEKVIDWLFGHIKGFDRSVAEYRFITENPAML